MENLNEKERLFCRYYLLTGNYREAAARSGYKNPERAGAKLLSAKRITDAVSKAREPSESDAKVMSGLKRIAFGSVADAIRLFFSDTLPQDYETMDFFCISEIKRSKGGNVEIKFFDRIKALEQLSRLSEGLSIYSTEPLYKVLEKSAQGLFPNGGGDDFGI